MKTPYADRNVPGEPRPTRRAVLLSSLATAIVSGAAATARAQNKAKQNIVQYQEKPKGNQQCDNCLQWVPPDACKIVEGKINSKGWCALYAPKPK